jgi:site-specific DNA-methyltransferase (adenine-specific)
MIKLILGDSFEKLDELEENSIGSVVCDPPYGLTSVVKRFGKENSAPAKFGSDGRFSRLSKGFLEKEWDGTGIEQNPEFWMKVLRVLKPGGHLLAFGGTRTHHRLTCAIEDSGFIIRDELCYIYGTGFPKSHTISDGIGTNLKPAFEPIILAQKPISEKSIRENYLKWGTGGINIDDCRIELNGEIVPINKLESWSGFGQEIKPDYIPTENIKGRWPANLILDEESSKLLDEQTGMTKSGNYRKLTRKRKGFMISGSVDNIQEANAPDSYGDFGGASRFFYCAKASKSEKEVEIDGIKISHPTSKPVQLMEYLVKLVNPKEGIVLDPFLGGGSTGVACKNLGFNFTGIEKEELYYKIAEKRILDE